MTTYIFICISIQVSDMQFMIHTHILHSNVSPSNSCFGTFHRLIMTDQCFFYSSSLPTTALTWCRGLFILANWNNPTTGSWTAAGSCWFHNHGSAQAGAFRARQSGGGVTTDWSSCWSGRTDWVFFFSILNTSRNYILTYSADSKHIRPVWAVLTVGSWT